MQNYDEFVEVRLYDLDGVKDEFKDVSGLEENQVENRENLVDSNQNSPQKKPFKDRKTEHRLKKYESILKTTENINRVSCPSKVSLLKTVFTDVRKLK